MTPLHPCHDANRAQKRFVIAGEAGYSEYWRRDKSSVEIMELAKLLRGIRKMVSQVGKNCGTVIWEGMSEGADSILLDPATVLGKYPVPAERADIAVGLAIRNAYLRTEWTDLVHKRAGERFQLPPIYHYKFTHYIDMAERVYADLIANRSVFGRYAQKAREWETAKAAKKYISPPTFTELLHIWWGIATDPRQEAFKRPYEDRSLVGMAGRTDAGQFYTKPLGLLNSIVEDLIANVSPITSISERCDYRLNRYASIFDELLDMVKYWTTDRNDPFLLPSEVTDDMAREDPDKEAVKATLVSFAEEIERHLDQGHVDYTDQVKSLVANFGDVVRVEGNDFAMPAKTSIDKTVLHNLKLVFRLAAQRNVSKSRGLDSGKIDRTRLYRASTTGTIFSLKNTRYELENDIVLLVDCTGSMAEPAKWAKVERVYQTLFTALLYYNGNARLFAYNERKERCRITEIYRQGRFYFVSPHGRTASGEAIIATALNLKHGVRRPFIIHITDGASNWGCGVNDAISYCQKKNIHLLTLGLGCNPMNKSALSDEHGELIQFIDNIDQLPALMKNLLVSTKYR